MKKILMIILDGFGYRENEYGNAVTIANMENFKRIFSEYPHSLLEASGEYVGLPHNQFGNSEVCHQVIGLGRTVKQKITILDEGINNSLLNNDSFLEMIKHVKDNKSTLHLMGLLPDGGVQDRKSVV